MSNKIHTLRLNEAMAKQLDAQYDDGNPATGAVKQNTAKGADVYDIDYGVDSSFQKQKYIDNMRRLESTPGFNKTNFAAFLALRDKLVGGGSENAAPVQPTPKKTAAEAPATPAATTPTDAKGAKVAANKDSKAVKPTETAEDNDGVVVTGAGQSSNKPKLVSVEIVITGQDTTNDSTGDTDDTGIDCETGGCVVDTGAAGDTGYFNDDAATMPEGMVSMESYQVLGNSQGVGVQKEVPLYWIQAYTGKSTISEEELAAVSTHFKNETDYTEAVVTWTIASFQYEISVFSDPTSGLIDVIVENEDGQKVQWNNYKDGQITATLENVYSEVEQDSAVFLDVLREYLYAIDGNAASMLP